MPNYQNSSVEGDKLIIGNCKVESAASIGTTYSNLGAGMVRDWNHPLVKYDVQSGNAPDPIEGIASETVTVDFDLIEYNASVLTQIHGGLITASTASSVITISAGGASDNIITPRVFRFTNTRVIDDASISTILTVFYATLDNGPQFSFKSDNDADPIMVMPCNITGKINSALAAGEQLYTIAHTLPTSQQ